ncbi:M61 family metallopeptidase [Sphingomonas antarctica]
MTYPKGWRAATALRGVTTGDTVKYETVSYDVLQDSPVLAGRFHREDDLGHNVFLNTVADDPKYLAASPAQLSLHRNLVDQAVKLFGARHFDHYDFLFSLSDQLGGSGLEHHRSSEDGVGAKYFTDWEASLPDHNLLPHEFTHSWDGKFRRGQDLWTPNFNTPMRDSLLWVYEGQTQFWGYVLEARSGLATKPQVLDALASIAAGLDNLPARDWRPLIDTTNDPIIASRKPKGWLSNQRSEDYYNEGMMIWLEADAIIRTGTKGTKGMDDFARAFFGMNDGDYGELTYTIDDVAQTLNSVYPNDWKAFLTQRLTRTGKGAPLDWVAASGYELRYDDTPSVFTKAVSASRKTLDLNYSLGISVGKPTGATVSKISGVMWDGPAYKAGLTVGQELVAVNDRPYTDEAINDAIKAAKGGRDPIRLTTKTQGLVKTYDLRWNGGLRYPHLVKVAKGDGPLDKLLAPRP